MRRRMAGYAKANPPYETVTCPRKRSTTAADASRPRRRPGGRRRARCSGDTWHKGAMGHLATAPEQRRLTESPIKQLNVLKINDTFSRIVSSDRGSNIPAAP